MDILNIDEVLEDDSFCLLGESNESEVEEILQQWKKGPKGKGPGGHFTAKSFIRLPQNLQGFDSTYSKFSFNFNDKENDSNNTGHYQNNIDTGGRERSIQGSFLFDTSPPSSSCFSEKNFNQLNTSLITSADFKSVAFFNLDDTEQFFNGKSSKSSYCEDSSDDSSLIAGMRCLNITQQPRNCFNDKTIENDDMTFVLPIENETFNHPCDDITFKLERDIQPMMTKLSASDSSSNDINSESSQSDLTFTKNVTLCDEIQPQNGTFQAFEKDDEILSNDISLDCFEKLNMSDICSEDHVTSTSHSTPFRKEQKNVVDINVSPICEDANKFKTFNKYATYKKNSDNDKWENLDITTVLSKNDPVLKERYRIRTETLTDFEELEKEIDCLTEGINPADSNNPHEDVKRIFTSFNNMKMKQSVDNIRTRYSSRNTAPVENCIPNTKNLFGSKDRLLALRSRLHDDEDPISLKENKNSCLPEKDEVSDDVTKDCTVVPSNERIRNNDRMKNSDRFKTITISRKRTDNDGAQTNSEPEVVPVEVIDNNIVKTDIKPKSVYQEPPEKTFDKKLREPSNLYRKGSRERIFSRPSYVKSYLQQNSAEVFQKANSAGELNEDAMKPSRMNQNIITNAIQPQSESLIRNKAKSFHNLSNSNVGEFKIPSQPDYQITNKEVNDKGISKMSQPLTNIRAIPLRQTRLARPSSGYYSNNLREGEVQQIVDHLPSKMTSINAKKSLAPSKASLITSSNIDLEPPNLKLPPPSVPHPISANIIIQPAEIAISNNARTQQQSKISKLKRSGLPRPSTVVKR